MSPWRVFGDTLFVVTTVVVAILMGRSCLLKMRAGAPDAPEVVEAKAEKEAHDKRLRASSWRCEQELRERAHDPSSVETDWWQWRYTAKPKAVIWLGDFRAKNSFGALRRSAFRCVAWDDGRLKLEVL